MHCCILRNLLVKTNIYLSGYRGIQIQEVVECFRPHSTESFQFAQAMEEVIIIPPVGIHGR